MRKKLRIGFMAGVFTLALSATAFAGEWKKDNVGWWYDNGDGSYPVNCWKWIDGNHDGIAECYYFDENGFCLTNTLTADGYAVDENGAWIVDKMVQQTQVSEPVELSDFLYDNNVYNVANRVGGMDVTQTNEFKECAIGDKLTVGILADSISVTGVGVDVYDCITDVINSGNRDVTLFNVRIGDDLETVKAKLNSCHYIFHTDIGNYGNGSYDFWCGDAALFQATFVDNVLLSYHYEVRYTG